MPPATLHGVGVITKLYYVIIAACKESTLNLAQGSFKVIHFGFDRKSVYYFIQVVYSKLNFSSIFNSFGDIGDFIRPSQLCK